jgi:hypothetical protein
VLAFHLTAENTTHDTQAHTIDTPSHADAECTNVCVRLRARDRARAANVCVRVRACVSIVCACVSCHYTNVRLRDRARDRAQGDCVRAIVHGRQMCAPMSPSHVTELWLSARPCGECHVTEYTAQCHVTQHDHCDMTLRKALWRMSLGTPTCDCVRAIVRGRL